MWHKAEWIVHPMTLDLTLAGFLVKLANHYTTRGASEVEVCRISKLTGISFRPDTKLETRDYNS